MRRKAETGDISRLELTSLHLRGRLIRCNNGWRRNQADCHLAHFRQAREQAVEEGVLVFQSRYACVIGPVKT